MARINMSHLFVALALVAAAALFHGTAAEDFVVGDTTGWTRPSSNTFYTTWASNKTFEVGDRLVFRFATGAHDVTKVTKAAYDDCTSANPMTAPMTTGPVTENLTTAGELYFICTFPGHCAAGQKLAVNVTADDGSTPSGTPTPTTGTNTTTPAGSASTIGATFNVIVMFVVVGLFY